MAQQHQSLTASFAAAIRGLVTTVRTQRNFRIELAIAALALILAAVLELSRIEWLVLVLTIALVLACELLNTALESTVDLACPDLHPLAKRAKDAAAAATLTAAALALIIGVLIYIPRILKVLGLTP
ncbi:MAG: diacylglycerol kinase family protein [Actinomycetes bacterium]|jgi:diacylglycerol kinase|nr:diacylglycerol kinase family protein [Actinomycetes bacterium]